MAGTLGEESNRIHQDSDVDNSVVALHHTLGHSATQSAAGNHNHDSDYAERTHTHDDLSGSGHEHTLNSLSDVVLNAPATDHFLGYGPDGNWTNEAIPKEAHSQIAATPPVPRGLGDLWVDTSADLLSWDSTWTVPILLNGWIQYSTGQFGSARYRKLPGNLVKITGLIKGGALADSVIFNLPTGYRPVYDTICIAWAEPNTLGHIYVHADGRVRVSTFGAGANNSALVLDMSYVADQ